jgi:hypothetical protein
VTLLGCVYLTETMAAVPALHNATAFACEYVGMTEAAKGYGQMRMFLLPAGKLEHRGFRRASIRCSRCAAAGSR